MTCQIIVTNFRLTIRIINISDNGGLDNRVSNILHKNVKRLRIDVVIENEIKMKNRIKKVKDRRCLALDSRFLLIQLGKRVREIK